MFDNNRVYIYILTIIILVVVVIIFITFSDKSSKTNENKLQEEIELDEIDDFPAFNKIEYAVVDSYEGYIDLPPHASYPEKLLNYLEEWTVTGDRKLPGRTYLMSKKLAGRDCKWIVFKDNQYCILKDE